MSDNDKKSPTFWRQPQENKFGAFIAQSEAQRVSSTFPKDGSIKSANAATGACNEPQPKVDKEWAAWGEYLGTKKDEDFIAWKKAQVGDHQQPASRIAAKTSPSREAMGREKENKTLSQKVWSKPKT